MNVPRQGHVSGVERGWFVFHRFILAPGKPALFLFATEDGTISGWSPTVDMPHALLKVDRSAAGAVYKGLALMGNQFYAANFHDNAVEVFNSDFSPAGSFTDATVPAGLAPFRMIPPTPVSSLPRGSTASSTVFSAG